MPTSPANPELVFSLRRVTERAAIAAFSWIGRGDSQDGGRAALEAMRAALADVDIDAVVSIGEATQGRRRSLSVANGSAVQAPPSRPTSPSIRSRARAISCAARPTPLRCSPWRRAAPC